MPDIGVSPLTIVGTRIHKARKARGFTLRQVADTVGYIGVAYLCDLEKGRKCNPTLETLYAISQSLRCSIGYLVGEHAFLPRLESER